MSFQMGTQHWSILAVSLQTEAFPSLATALYKPTQSNSSLVPAGTITAWVFMLVPLKVVPTWWLQKSHSAMLLGRPLLPSKMIQQFAQGTPAVKSSGSDALVALQGKVGRGCMAHHALLWLMSLRKGKFGPSTRVFTITLSALPLGQAR